MKLLLAAIASLLFVLSANRCLARERQELLSEELCLLGFENVKVLTSGNILLACMENNIYGWNVEGIVIVLDCLSKNSTAEKEIILYALDHGIPQIRIKVNSLAWKSFRNGEIQAHALRKMLSVDSKLQKDYKLLENTLYWNSNLNKIDFVIYPQFALQNTGFNQIYETQLNLAPAMEVDLWKGMQFTGQVIFPLHNELSKEGDEVRPGFVSISQNFRIASDYFGKLVVGNFNANRYGGYMSMRRPIWKNRIEIGANAGITGSSYFYKGRWLKGNVNELNWFLKARYFHHRYDLQFDLSYGKYIAGDHGIRADLTRHFGRIAIGCYVMCSDGRSNGGFHFSLPLAKKQNRRHLIRIKPANFFDWEYNAGTEFVKGRYYETRPNENRTENNYNPMYLKTQLLNL
ncbi:hypothetical protein [Marinifilum sp.]|uniref:hypothetical protein n=1 Tax=Marinifilum sp. TaxID=2033137 RepID=UPI003BABA513